MFFCLQDYRPGSVIVAVIPPEINVTDLDTANIQDAWRRITTQLHELDAQNQFNSAATREQIAKLELELGTRLPVTLVALLGCQNGCVEYFDQLLVDAPFLSTQEILSEWKVNCEVDEDSNADVKNNDITDYWRHRRCIPICGANGDCICIDSKTGLMYAHSSGMGGLRGPIAPTLVEWLGNIADQLESGSFKIEDSKVTIETIG